MIPFEFTICKLLHSFFTFILFLVLLTKCVNGYAITECQPGYYRDENFGNQLLPYPAFCKDHLVSGAPFKSHNFETVKCMNLKNAVKKCCTELSDYEEDVDDDSSEETSAVVTTVYYSLDSNSQPIIAGIEDTTTDSKESTKIPINSFFTKKHEKVSFHIPAVIEKFFFPLPVVIMLSITGVICSLLVIYAVCHDFRICKFRKSAFGWCKSTVEETHLPHEECRRCEDGADKHHHQSSSAQDTLLPDGGNSKVPTTQPVVLPDSLSSQPSSEDLSSLRSENASLIAANESSSSLSTISTRTATCSDNDHNRSNLFDVDGRASSISTSSSSDNENPSYIEHEQSSVSVDDTTANTTAP